MLSARTLLLLAALIAAVCGTLIPFYDERLAYLGRWQVDQNVARSDWPCSGLHFRVMTSASTTIGLRLKLLRVRVMVKITDERTSEVEDITLSGNSILGFPETYDIAIDKAGSHMISLTKMTQAAPYGNGLGKLLTSTLNFHGVEIDDNVVILEEHPPVPTRRINFIGASDTAGFCVDGTPETFDATVEPWKYDHCGLTAGFLLGTRFNAETRVQAIAGIGVTQNAFADQPFLLGEETMPDYYDRTLQTELPAYNLSAWNPNLVVVSLGGNDFNHQSVVPSNEKFREAYQDFIRQVIEPYAVPLTVVSICGQGDPTELERDPNNDRCRPCPHVQNATKSFQQDGVRVEYIFIPCDGTVITGVDDIGCEGHKNQLGQQRVADFLEPNLREIMRWNETQTLTIESAPEPTPWSEGVSVAVTWIQRLMGL